MFDYIDLHFIIHSPRPHAESSREHILVVNSQEAGAQVGRFVTPLPEDEVAHFVGMLDALMGTSARGVRRGTPEHDRIEELGQAFFNALLSTRGVRTVYDRTWAKLQEHDRFGLRVRLTCEDKHLVAFPWEILHDGSRFLFLSARIVLVRNLLLTERIDPISVTPPLRILVAIASPQDLPPLNTQEEIALIERSIRYLGGKAAVDILVGASFTALQARLRQARAKGAPFHILHFIGHGGYDVFSREGYLAFENQSHDLEQCSSKQLAQLLTGYPTLRLAVLNACQTAQADRCKQRSGVAEAIVEAGIPAVIAMQFPISDRAAIQFTQTFYEAVADGLPIDAAIGESRLAIYGDGDSLEFGTPVLYARIEDGQIFKREPLMGISSPDTLPPKPAELSQIKGMGSVKPPSDEELMEDLLGSDLTRIRRAASFLAEAGKTEDFRKRLLGWFNDPAASYQHRIAIGRAFAFIGDPRDLEEMILIPAGRFWLGSHEAYVRSMIEQGYRYFSLDETPIQRQFLPSFQIARYPVTNQQYLEFLRAMPGHAAPPHWENRRFAQELANHPVVHVSWHDAVAYARWRRKRLPTEFEWEKAARGPTKWQYPWGDEFDRERCNVQLEIKTCETTSVGVFPAGASYYGVLDMAGNVWEWTNSYYLPYPGNNGSVEGFGDQYRAMRGGSWANPSHAARCPCRLYKDSRKEFNNVGFRLAASEEG